MRAMEDDVIRLPLTRRPRGIDEWRILPVDGTGLAVRVRVVLVGIEHLQLIDPHEKDAAVAALLAFTLWRSRRAPLDVQLHVAEAACRDEHAGVRFDLDVAVFDDPFRRGAVLRAPLRKVRAVEQHDSIARRGSGRTFGPGVYHGRPRAIHRVLRPLRLLRL